MEKDAAFKVKVANMREDKTEINDMRHQEQLKAQMQGAFRAGNHGEVERLKKKLEADDPRRLVVG